MNKWKEREKELLEQIDILNDIEDSSVKNVEIRLKQLKECKSWRDDEMKEQEERFKVEILLAFEKGFNDGRREADYIHSEEMKQKKEELKECVGRLFYFENSNNLDIMLKKIDEVFKDEN
jgi:hypothetical protein